MTIKNIMLSAIAASLVTTAAVAGTVTSQSGSTGLIGTEALSLADVNVSNPFSNLVYMPTEIPATSLKNPVFKFEFANSKDMNKVADDNASVWECVDGNDTNYTAANWKQVAYNPQFSGTNNNIVSFNAVSSDIYAYNNKKYIVADGNTTGTDANLTSENKSNLQIIVVKGSTSDVVLKASLYSGDSQALTDSASASIAKVGPEFTASITQKFDARIDASSGFRLFYDQNSDGVTKKADNAIINIHQNATLGGASLGEVPATLVVAYDQNTSKYISNTGDLIKFSSLDNASVNSDLNVSETTDNFTANTAEDVNATVTLTTNATSPDEIKKTQFTANAYVMKGTNKFTILPATTKNAGEWTIYGYNAQIPDVMPTDAYVTYMKFTNRSTLNTGVYFTLIDQDGIAVPVNSVDDGIASLPANTTMKYKASDLAAIAFKKNPNFDMTKSISIEVSIPTTPSSVYGMASLKNVALGQFKDLPIYNNSGLNY